MCARSSFVRRENWRGVCVSGLEEGGVEKGGATHKAEPSGSMLAGTKISSKNWVRTGSKRLDTGWKGEE
jgi:hypothetical protein